MAIDTAAKRKSCVGLGLLGWRMGVIPDGSNLSASQRLHTNGLYSGIASDSGAVTWFDGLTTSRMLMGVGHLWLIAFLMRWI